MSTNGDRDMSPPLFEDPKKEEHAFSSSHFSEGPNDTKPYPQKESKEADLKQSQTTSSVKEKQEQFKSLEDKIFYFELAKAIFMVIIFGHVLLAIVVLSLLIKIYGMPFYSIFLLSHSLSFLGLYVVHYQYLLPLIDKGNLISYKIEEELYNVPPHHPPKRELSWFSLRHMLPFITNAGIWICLSCMDIQNDVEDTDPTDKEIIICLFLGVLMLLVFISAMAKIGPTPARHRTVKYKTKQGKEDAAKKFNLKIYDLLSGLKTETIEELNKFRKEMLENNASYSELEKENDALYSRLKKENDALYSRLKKENDASYSELKRENSKILMELLQEIKKSRKE
ncbi:hypothetical protein MOSE0_I05930 [Monosporozyma servazzii]